MLLATSFAATDWMLLGLYLAVLVGIGLGMARRTPSQADFFLASRSMPVWAVALSVLATTQSAATFLGVPEQSFKGNLTYLSAALSGILAAWIVGTFILPAFYCRNVTSIYELLGHEMGTPARTAASGMFMIGRVFASGARLYMVAIAVALLIFDDTKPLHICACIAGVMLLAVLYTSIGGIRAVIWTDVLQAVVALGTVSLACWMLIDLIPDSTSTAEILTALRNAPTDAPGTVQNKLTWLDTRLAPEPSYTIWTVLIGITLINIAANGCDQDLTQRMLTCRDAKAAGRSVLLSAVFSIPILMLFSLAGLLLYVFYQCPDLMGVNAPAQPVEEGRKVFVQFILSEMPSPMRGLMMAGLLAAAMSSTDSALNAMASTTVADFIKPWRRRLGIATDDARIESSHARLAVLVWGVMIAGFAMICVYWQQYSEMRLIDFALQVMVFAYSGMLAVFLAALFTKRGNEASAVAALATGFGLTLFMQSHWFRELMNGRPLAFAWQMTIATTICFLMCISVPRRPSDAASSD